MFKELHLLKTHSSLEQNDYKNQQYGNYGLNITEKQATEIISQMRI